MSCRNYHQFIYISTYIYYIMMEYYFRFILRALSMLRLIAHGIKQYVSVCNVQKRIQINHSLNSKHSWVNNRKCWMNVKTNTICIIISETNFEETNSNSILLELPWNMFTSCISHVSSGYPAAKLRRRR